MFNSEIVAKQIGVLCSFEPKQYAIKFEKVYYQGREVEESSITFYTNEVDYKVEAKFHCVVGVDYAKIDIHFANELMKTKYEPALKAIATLCAIDVIATLGKAMRKVVITVGEEVKE